MALRNELQAAATLETGADKDGAEFTISSADFELNYVVVAAGPDGIRVDLAPSDASQVPADRLQKMKLSLMDINAAASAAAAVRSAVDD